MSSSYLQKSYCGDATFVIRSACQGFPGNGTLRLGDDQWTLITNDGCPAAHFEHTIALVEGAVRVLTTGG